MARSKTLSVVMALLLFAMPFLTLAQQTGDAAQAIIDATADAQKADTTLWTIAGIGSGLLFGCILGPLTIIGAYALPPTPPAMKLIGKSPEYVVVYTDTYQSIAKKEQATSATLGCLFGSGVSALMIIYLQDIRY